MIDGRTVRLESWCRVLNGDQSGQSKENFCKRLINLFGEDMMPLFVLLATKNVRLDCEGLKLHEMIETSVCGSYI